jgi:hypothetical protein
MTRFHEKENKDLTLLSERSDDPEKKIMVFFPKNPPEAKTGKVPVQIVESIIQTMRREGVNRSIIAIERPLLNHSQTRLDSEMEKEKLADPNSEWRVEIFLVNELKVRCGGHGGRAERGAHALSVLALTRDM